MIAMEVLLRFIIPFKLKIIHINELKNPKLFL